MAKPKLEDFNGRSIHDGTREELLFDNKKDESEFYLAQSAHYGRLQEWADKLFMATGAIAGGSYIAYLGADEPLKNTLSIIPGISAITSVASLGLGRYLSKKSKDAFTKHINSNKRI